MSGWDALRIVGLAPKNAPVPPVLILDRTGRNRALDNIRIRPTVRPYSAWPLPADHPSLAYAPVVHLARAIADAALSARALAPVRAVVTSCVQRGVCLPQDLQAELDACPRAHSRLLRVAIQDIVDGARSVAEAEAADHLRASGVPPFEQNVPIVDSQGRVIAVVDVLWRELKAVLEIDSREFHFSERDWRSTMQRHNDLIGYGLTVRHDAPSVIRSAGAGWSESIRRWLDRRAAELGVEAGTQASSRRRSDASDPVPFLVAT